MLVSGMRKALFATLPSVENAGGIKRGTAFSPASLVTDPEKQLSLMITSVACG
jgi:hypothetical protein